MSGGLHSLATIIKRLEAATSRLEDLADAQGAPRPRTDDIQDEHNSYSRSSTPAPPAIPVPTPPPPPPPAPVVEETPRTVVAYDEMIIEGKLQPFLELTRSFAGASVIEQVALVEKMFSDLRSVLLAANSCRKPDQSAFTSFLAPLLADIEAITRLKETYRKDRDWFTHLSAVAEGAPCVGWIAIESKPAPYVKDIMDSTQFYGDRVIKGYKEKDPKHVEWVRAYIAILKEMQEYIKQYHTTGLVWNAKGIALDQYEANSTASSAAAPPPPPPPPPPAPAPPPPPVASSTSGGGGPGLGAVFADLNRGEDVTKGLKKVEKSQMTHKNPALRASGVVPASTSSAAAASKSPKKPLKPSKPHALQGKKPAKFELLGSKWMVEYQENESMLIIDNTEISHTINLYGCKNTTIQVKGKVNGITMVNCTKTSILVQSVISAISITASPSFAIQITGSAPTIQLDNTDSGQIYLSKECLGVEITTAKCSSINVSLPVEGEEEGVFGEHPIPEMLKTTVKDGKLVTAIVEHVG
ncbi:hypothetical protein JAAARDRAFT_32984 [Jaapia argillacea MUCL 33604]|uniref:Adenylyl cyclase-associated protein n=1 Tax=Jaapia argillacea MUCL 33604 TaxID=933084 RepID=A0A067PXM0_9AGAM|nr:hypothetical protein JAAARDRAFT_32984 [Jaapia argillacea MUCL 33604]